MTNHWIPRSKWDALIRGENCPLCDTVRGDGADNEFNYFITDLSMGRLVLDKNQYVKGYSLLICFKHVREPYELPQDEQERFWDDMVTAGLALEKVFRSDKMNFQILGNAVPHLHCHLVPRYYGDEGGNRPTDPHTETFTLKPEEYAERVIKIREMLAIVRV